jgi:hypothetical protein
MGKCVNKVILLGRAGKDPSVHILRTGTIVNLSFATSERYRDIHGDWQELRWSRLFGQFSAILKWKPCSRFGHRWFRRAVDVDRGSSGALSQLRLTNKVSLSHSVAGR